MRHRRRECAGCAGRGPDTAFPSRRRRTPDLCIDCLREAARNAGRYPHAVRTPPVTRATARARYRARLKAAQLDMVDLLLSAPP